MDGEQKTAETQRAKEDVSLCDSSSIRACVRACVCVCVHPVQDKLGWVSSPGW